ncbi:TPA: hypothetical protein T7M09_001685 [Streptococcus suis]|nr:hypothetical protein [Streptococcus suis]
MSEVSTEKTFKCEYFDIFEYVNGSPVPFDLEKWINCINIENYAGNAVKYLDDYVRIEDIDYSNHNKLWFFRFLRIRDKDVPLLCKKEAEAEELLLSDDEYVAEPMVCLYDPENFILMVQKNSHSVSAVGIEKYFHETFKDSKVRLNRKIDSVAFDKVANAQQVVKIRLRMSEVDVLQRLDMLSMLKSKLGRAIDSMGDIGIPYYDITLSTGRYKSKELNESEKKDLLEDILLLNDNLKDHVERADFTVRNEGISEFISLFGNVIQDELTVVQDRKTPINYNVVKDKMRVAYENRKLEFKT